MGTKLYLAALILCAAPVHLGASEVFYCPWADTVVKLELSDGRDRVTLKAGSGNFGGSPPLPTILATKRIGASEIEVVEFSVRDAGYHNIFQLEFLQADIVMLNNVRMIASEDQVWRDRGYCLSANSE